MSVQMTVSKSAKAGGISFPETRTLTDEGVIAHDVSVPAADAGSLSTRTNATDGVLTMDDSGHGITQDDRVDIFWVGGSCRGANADTVSGATVEFSGAIGDDLPTQGTEITAIVPTELDVAVLGTNVSAISMYAEEMGHFVFDDGAEEWFQRLGSGVVRIWHESDGEDNPITGDTIATVYVSHGAITAKTMRLALLYDND